MNVSKQLWSVLIEQNGLKYQSVDRSGLVSMSISSVSPIMDIREAHVLQVDQNAWIKIWTDFYRGFGDFSRCFQRILLMGKS